MTLRFAFRVDASAEMGLGHVKRCLSLAHQLREMGAAVVFVARPLGVDVPAATRAEGFDCVLLPAPSSDAPVADTAPHAQWARVGWHEDADETIAALQDRGVDWMVVDHYAFDACWHDAIASGLRCRLAAIDDVADRPMNVDILINHNQAPDHRGDYDGHLRQGTTLLVGPRFALLGPSYATAPRYAFSERVRSIGIFMGGTDAANFTATALRACRSAGFIGPVEIVTTSNNPNLSELTTMVQSDRAAALRVDLPDLSEFFARHDLQIGASGGATWERCCIGVPTLALIAADNQRRVLLPLIASGAVHPIESTPPSVEEISRAIKSLLEDVAARRRLCLCAANLVDGLGACRAATRLVNA